MKQFLKLVLLYLVAALVGTAVADGVRSWVAPRVTKYYVGGAECEVVATPNLGSPEVYLKCPLVQVQEK
jgi:hypothetical protein